MKDLLLLNGSVSQLIIERTPFLKRGNKFIEGEKFLFRRVHFDENDQPVREIFPQGEILYNYDDNGKKRSSLLLDKNSEEKERTCFHYREERLDHEKTSNTKGEILKSVLYDDQKRPIRVEQGNVLIKSLYEKRETKEFFYYGNKGEMIRQSHFNDDGDLIERITHDKKGSPIRKERYQWENKLLLSSRIVNGNNEILVDDQFEYECFHKGNWLRRITYRFKIPFEIIYRSINYSPPLPPITMADQPPSPVIEKGNKTIAFEDGSLYKGEINHGQMNGKGELIWKGGMIYKGDFTSNLMEGEGTLIWPNGDIYEGTFSKGLMEGIGRFTWKGGKRFYGLFENGKITRQGIIEETSVSSQ